MSRAETAAQLDQEIADAILGAKYFSVSIFYQGEYIKHPLKDLATALAVCPLLEQKLQSTRAAMIYAVSADDRSLMIPREKAERAVAFLATKAAAK